MENKYEQVLDASNIHLYFAAIAFQINGNCFNVLLTVHRDISV